MILNYRQTSGLFLSAFLCIFRLPISDVSVAEYPGQVATVKSIYLTPRNEDFIRHLKKEKERQRRQEMSNYRGLDNCLDGK